MDLALNDNVAFEILDGKAVILHLDSGIYYQLNVSATLYWLAIVESEQLADLVKRVAGIYQVEPENVEEDFKELTRYWLRIGLVKHVTEDRLDSGPPPDSRHASRKPDT